MKLGLYGKKLGMTQIFDEKTLRHLPVTVISLYDATVIAHRNTDVDGYGALVLGFDAVAEKKLTKPAAGLFKKTQSTPFRHVKEVRVSDVAPYPQGSVLTVEAFDIGEEVHVAGVSKGKGFQGVIKRHGKAGGPAAHGSHFHRSTGSIGQRTYPGKVFKNMGMAGRMGGERVKTKNLEVVCIDPANHLLFVKGAVPGSRDGLVFVETRKKAFSKGIVKKEVPAAAAETV